MRSHTILRCAFKMANGVGPRLGIDAALHEIAMTLLDACRGRTKRDLGRFVVLVRQQRRVGLWVVGDRTGNRHAMALVVGRRERRAMNPFASCHWILCLDLSATASAAARTASSVGSAARC